MVEEKYWGGVCLNVGCIPSKALLRNAEIAHIITQEKATFGISGEATMDYGVTHARSRKVADASAKGVHFLMKKNKITELDGWGTIKDPKTVEVKGKDGQTQTVTCDNLIIATGATTRLIPGTSLSERVVTYEEQILTDQLPRSIIIAGSGAIGVEFAYVMKNFGVDVTIVEFLDRMVPTEDADVSKELLKQYKKLGVKVMLSTKVEAIEDTGSNVRVTVSPAAGGDQQVLEADKVLQAIGFAPRLEGYGSRTAASGHGPRCHRDRRAGPHHRRRRLRHRRRHREADARAHRRGHGRGGGRDDRRRRDHRDQLRHDPRATFCQPQIASFGYSEEQAKEMGYDVKTASFPFSANGKARGMAEGVGFVKIVADAKHNEIVGAHLIGPEVTELLPALTLAQMWDLTADEVARNIFAHPTLSEAMKEAIEGIAGHMINL